VGVVATRGLTIVGEAMLERTHPRSYKQGFTMEEIATQLSVDKSQISRALVNCCDVQQSKPAKTASNPKGAGRPKGSGKQLPPALQKEIANV
jgi:hypothetical protein